MNAQDSSPQANVPVLIVGGGMPGISAALMLQYHGVDFVLVDKGNGLSVRPKARVIHKRSVEILRQLDIENRMAEVSLAFTSRKQGALGVRIGPTMAGSEVMEVAPRGYRGDELSPVKFLFAPQEEAEGLLAEIARERGGDLRFQTELTDFTADADGVDATLVGPGGTTTLHADYMIVVDGENEPTRKLFGTGGWELPASQHYVSTYFRADLTGGDSERTFSQLRLVGGPVEGLMASTNFIDEWSLYIEYDPAEESFADFPAERCVELIRTAVGQGDIDVELINHEAWNTGSWVCDEYRKGRVFIAGDAAHRQPPWGGYSPNLGIADAHNLVWKLAAVLAGTAADALLDTYAAERRRRGMVAAEQSAVMNDFHARFGVKTPENAAALESLIGMEPTMTRYRYGAPEELHVETLAGQTGTRVPHIWLTEGERKFSTLDLCGRGFTVLADTDLDTWRDAVAEVRAATGLEITVAHVDPALAETPDAWHKEAELPDGGGALLIRPDQHVVARSDGDLSPSTLLDIVKRAVA